MSPASGRIDEGALTKGQIRKLNALRKSVGAEIGERAFSEWMAQQAAVSAAPPRDRNADLIAESLWGLIEQRKLRIRRGGYVVTRGRGRVVVQPATD